MKKAIWQFRDREIVVVDATWRTGVGDRQFPTALVWHQPRRFALGRRNGGVVQVPDTYLWNTTSIQNAEEKMRDKLPERFIPQFLSLSNGATALKTWLESSDRNYRGDSPVITLRTDVVYGGKFPKLASIVSVSNFRHDSFDDNCVATPLTLLHSLELHQHTSQSTSRAVSPEDARRIILADLGIKWTSRTQPYFIIRKDSLIHYLVTKGMVSLQFLTRQLIPAAHEAIWSPMGWIDELKGRAIKRFPGANRRSSPED